VQRPVETAVERLAETAVREAPERLEELDQERLALLTSAGTLSETGISPDAPNRLWRTVRDFSTTVTRVHGQTPFPGLAEALEILQNCIAGLREQRQMNQLRAQELNFCLNAARLVA
jgi:hypothetical protein